MAFPKKGFGWRLIWRVGTAPEEVEVGVAHRGITDPEDVEGIVGGNRIGKKGGC